MDGMFDDWDTTVLAHDDTFGEVNPGEIDFGKSFLSFGSIRHSA